MKGPPVLRAPPLADGSLPRQLVGARSPIVWGIVLLLFIEGTVVGLMVVSYFYLRLGAGTWPPAGIEPPSLTGPLLAQGLLLLSPVPVWLGMRAIARGRRGPLLVGLPAGLALAAGYLALEALEFAGKDFLWSSHAYGSLEWTLGGHGAFLVLALILQGLVVWILTVRGHFRRHRYTGVQVLLVYWGFVAAASLPTFVAQYLSPHW